MRIYYILLVDQILFLFTFQLTLVLLNFYSLKLKKYNNNLGWKLLFLI